MVINLGKWPSKRVPISKIRPSEGCRRDVVLLAVERWYDFPEFGGYLENVGKELHVHGNLLRRVPFDAPVPTLPVFEVEHGFVL